MYGKNPRFQDNLLLFGVFFFFLGTILLLRTTGLLPTYGMLWPLIGILLGSILLFLVFFRQYSENYILPGMILVLAGFFFLLVSAAVQPIGLYRIWPLFMLVPGLSLIPYAMRKTGNARIVLLVPAVTITGLALVFLLFSLQIIPVRFRAFVVTWWPSLFVLLGIALFFTYVRRRDESGGS